MAEIITLEKELISGISDNKALTAGRLPSAYSIESTDSHVGSIYKENDDVLVPRAHIVRVDSVTMYSDVSIGTTSYDDLGSGDIPASGGKRRAQATVTYKEWTRTYFLDHTDANPHYIDSTKLNKSTIIYGSLVEADAKPAETSNRTLVGTSTPSGTVAGATRTGTALNIYQAANAVTKLNVWNVSDYTYTDIPANGGECSFNSYPVATIRRYYTSGNFDTLTDTFNPNTLLNGNYGSWYFLYYPGYTQLGDECNASDSALDIVVVGCSSRGNSGGGREQRGYVEVLYSLDSSYTSDSRYGSGYADVWQAGNTGVITVTSLSVGFATDVPASGSGVWPTIIATLKNTFTSGGSETLTDTWSSTLSKSGTTYTGAYGTFYLTFASSGYSSSFNTTNGLIAANRETTLGERRLIGDFSVTYAVSSNTSSTKTNSCSTYQAANHVASIAALASTGYTTHFTYTGYFPASGGELSPSTTGAATYTFSSGSTKYDASSIPSFGGSATYARTYSCTSTTGTYTVDANGKLTAQSFGTTIAASGGRATVNSQLTITYTHPTGSSGGVKTSFVANHSVFVLLDANIPESVEYIQNSPASASIPWNGGTVTPTYSGTIKDKIIFSSGESLEQHASPAAVGPYSSYSLPMGSSGFSIVSSTGTVSSSNVITSLLPSSALNAIVHHIRSRTISYQGYSLSGNETNIGKVTQGFALLNTADFPLRIDFECNDTVSIKRPDTSEIIISGISGTTNNTTSGLYNGQIYHIILASEYVSHNSSKIVFRVNGYKIPNHDYITGPNVYQTTEFSIYYEIAAGAYTVTSVLEINLTIWPADSGQGSISEWDLTLIRVNGTMYNKNSLIVADCNFFTTPHYALTGNITIEYDVMTSDRGVNGAYGDICINMPNGDTSGTPAIRIGWIVLSTDNHSFRVFTSKSGGTNWNGYFWPNGTLGANLLSTNTWYHIKHEITSNFNSYKYTICLNGTTNYIYGGTAYQASNNSLIAPGVNSSTYKNVRLFFGSGSPATLKNVTITIS